MRVKVFYDEDDQAVAICRTSAEFAAADNQLHSVPGARFTVRDEERDTPLGEDSCVACGQEFGDANTCCCDGGTHIDGSHDDGYCKACCPNPHVSYPWPTYERCDCA